MSNLTSDQGWVIRFHLAAACLPSLAFHIHSLGFDCGLHGWEVVHLRMCMHVSALCPVILIVTLTFNRGCWTGRGLNEFVGYNIRALSKESSIYMSSIISWQDSGLALCFHLLFCWLHVGVERWINKETPPPPLKCINNLLSIPCSVVKGMAERSGNDSADTPRKWQKLSGV